MEHAEAVETSARAPGDKVAQELQNIFLDLLTAAQELAYELATLESKDTYTAEDIQPFLKAARNVVTQVKRMHKFLKQHGRRPQ
jgi:cob(I)alamin adenosyltransferase